MPAKLLGHHARGDGDTLPDINKARCAIARQRFCHLTQLWKDKRLEKELKLAYYVRLVTSIVARGNEAWKVNAKAQARLNGFVTRVV